METFNLTQANEMSNTDAKAYIKKYFYPLTSGQHILVSYDENNKPICEIKEDAVIKSVYFNRLPKGIQTFYFKEYDQIKTLTCELNKPFVYGNFINTCPPLMHSVKTYSEYLPDVKAKVDMMLGFIKEIWASNNEKQYQFIIKWFANMARGGKNQSVLYLRGEQGIGKSTFTDFLRKYVIGPKLCIQSGSQPLISQFNAILFCKLLVIFEELENFSTGQWQGVSTRLKRDTTSDTCMYEEKNQKCFTAKNISNYIINSNVDAIKDDDGRRYFILDLSNKRKGDRDFFDNIHHNCMSDAVGEAFFSYLMTVDLKDYHDQDFPQTRAKDDAIAKRLDSVIMYLKEKYILKTKDFDTNLKDAYLEYVSYCSIDGCKECCKIEFNKRLELLNITTFKSGNEHKKYKVKHETLMIIATKNKWIHSTDTFEDAKDQIDLFDDVDKEKEEMRAEIKQLKERLELLSKPKEVILQKVVIEIVSEEQKILNELYKQQVWIKDIYKPKKKKQDPKIFELFMDELENLCN